MLKYNSREQLKKKLNVLKCCIANKGLELANSIALALGNKDCLQQELDILNGYYEALKCYYPYDCYIDDLNVTVECGAIRLTDVSYELAENCLTDEQAEKMIRHAISMCDCCTEININNEILNLE